MSDDRPLGRLVLLLGGEPGADPHDVAHDVASRLERAVHVDLESLQEVVVSGSLPMTASAPASEPLDPARVEQLFLRWLAGLAVAETYQRAGFDAVLSDRVSGGLLDDLLDFVDPAPVHLVVIGEEGPPSTVRGGLRLEPGAAAADELAGSVVERLDEALLG